MSRTWRQIAAETIARVADAAKAEGLDEAATLERIDAAYPFGERACHPYKVWLAERKLWRQRHQGYRAPGSAAERERLAAWTKGEPIR